MGVPRQKLSRFGLALLVWIGSGALPLRAQTAASDALSQQVLRALQQRGTGQTVDPGVSSSVTVESPPVYSPSQQPAINANGELLEAWGRAMLFPPWSG